MTENRLLKYVLVGVLILTAEGGSPQPFVVGQSVLVPKGLTGAWDLQGNIREMVVIMNEDKEGQEWPVQTKP